MLFEATGAPPVAFQALEALGHNGVLVLFGLPGSPSALELDAAAVVRNLVLRNQLVLGHDQRGPRGLRSGDRATCGAFEIRWPGVRGGSSRAASRSRRMRELLQGPLRGIKNVIAVG